MGFGVLYNYKRNAVKSKGKNSRFKIWVLKYIFLNSKAIICVYLVGGKEEDKDSDPDVARPFRINIFSK